MASAPEFENMSDLLAYELYASGPPSESSVDLDHYYYNPELPPQSHCDAETFLDNVRQRAFEHKEIKATRQRVPLMWIEGDDKAKRMILKQDLNRDLKGGFPKGEPFFLDPRREKRKQQMANLRKLPESWLENYHYHTKAESIKNGPKVCGGDDDDDDDSCRSNPPRSFAPPSLSEHSLGSLPFLDAASQLAAERDGREPAVKAETVATNAPSAKKARQLRKWKVKLANLKQKAREAAEDIGIAVRQRLPHAIRRLLERARELLKDMVGGGVWEGWLERWWAQVSWRFPDVREASMGIICPAIQNFVIYAFTSLIGGLDWFFELFRSE